MSTKGMQQQRMPVVAEGDTIVRLPPYFYMHVLDFNSNVTRVEVGPKTFIRQDNERITQTPDRMITIPPRHFCTIENPVVRDTNGAIVYDESGQAKLQHADLEIRMSREPFPLYPGEVLKQPVTPLRVVPANSALRLKAVLDFEEDGNKRFAGDEWLFEGPGTYIPRKEVNVEEVVRATVIRPNQALKLRARRETQDRDGKQRVTGEEWIVSKVGAYLPGAYEEVVDVVDAYVLTEKKALHVRATRTFKDQFGVVRKNGEEWLVKMSDAETYIPDVYEQVVGIVDITTLTNRQYLFILNPIGADGKPQLGKRKLVKGEKSFFLMPGESLESGIQNVYVLSELEGLILKANEAFKDEEEGAERSAGDRWMIRGPREYVPSVQVDVVSKISAIPLDENEGIYVRDMKTGKVRSIVGLTYMLTQDEELWEKELPPAVEELLISGRDPLADRGYYASNVGFNAMQQQAESKQQKPSASSMKRDRTRVVTYRVPHNAAVQVYDYKEKKARVVFGPDLVILAPDEHFTQLSLSGGKPKRPNVIKSLCLLLGPDFCTDIVTVETADHARLQLQLSYNWHFDVGDKSAMSKQQITTTAAEKLFSVPDFVGDACKAIASRVRGMVAQVQFDDFHKNSARIIRTAVFGLDENQKVRSQFLFPANNLVITSIDIQSVEPVDQRTRDSLQKSVQLAIEITTNSQEAAARHEAERREQEAKGKLERQRISDEAAAERSRKELLELQAASAAVESTGQAKAEAQSRAEAAKIEGEAAVDQARLKAEASKIETESELARLTAAREAELRYVGEKNALEVTKSREDAEIETSKFKRMVDAIGATTIQAIATSGPDMQVKLLKALGMQSTLITDGTTPINLFQTAQGLIGAIGGGGPTRAISGKKPEAEDD